MNEVRRVNQSNLSKRVIEIDAPGTSVKSASTAEESRRDSSRDESEDEDERTEPMRVLIVAFSQVFLICFNYSIVIPTARQYTESLGAPAHFEGYVIGAASFGAILLTPVYRLMLRKGFALTFSFQVVCIQLGSVLYALAKAANKLELLVAGRLLSGMGSTIYPSYQFFAERIGKKHRSKVLSQSGIGRALGFGVGPALAAVLVYVDFNIGDLTIDKETNAGWTVAIYCLFQLLLIVALFPREGSNMIEKKKQQEPNDLRPLREKIIYAAMICFVVSSIAIASFFITSWEVAATNVIQTHFGWSIQWSALLVGGIAFSPAVIFPVMAKLSYRFTDKKILIAQSVVQLVSSVGLFNFGNSSLAAALYLAISFFYFNAVTLQVVFSMATSSKVCFPHHVEPIQLWVTVAATLSRGLGGIFGAMMTVNQMAILCISGALFSLIGNLTLLNPKVTL